MLNTSTTQTTAKKPMGAKPQTEQKKQAPATGKKTDTAHTKPGIFANLKSAVTIKVLKATINILEDIIEGVDKLTIKQRRGKNAQPKGKNGEVISHGENLHLIPKKNEVLSAKKNKVGAEKKFMHREQIAFQAEQQRAKQVMAKQNTKRNTLHSRQS